MLNRQFLKQHGNLENFHFRILVCGGSGRRGEDRGRGIPHDPYKTRTKIVDIILSLGPVCAFEYVPKQKYDSLLHFNDSIIFLTPNPDQ